MYAVPATRSLEAGKQFYSNHSRSSPLGTFRWRAVTRRFGPKTLYCWRFFVRNLVNEYWEEIATRATKGARRELKKNSCRSLKIQGRTRHDKIIYLTQLSFIDDTDIK